MKAFSTPPGWMCFDELCSKYHRNINQSKVFRMIIEEKLKEKNKPTSLDIYTEESQPAILPQKELKSFIKTQTTEELKELLTNIEISKLVIAMFIEKRDMYE